MQRREVLQAIALSATLFFVLAFVRRRVARVAEPRRLRVRVDEPREDLTDGFDLCSTCGLARLPEESARFLRFFAEGEP